MTRFRSILIGSVTSTKIVFDEMMRLGCLPEAVFALSAEASKNVSGFFPMGPYAAGQGVESVEFTKINAPEHIDRIKQIAPDFIFVIGLSQLISDEIVTAAKEYCIGLHPTKLPENRGRAAIPWQIILGVRESALTLFKLDSGMDTGDILVQEPYIIQPDDYASDVHERIDTAIAAAAGKALPAIMNGTAAFHKQKDEDATYLLIRRPEDGKIQWTDSPENIHALIRGTSKPYPGAFCYYGEAKITLWRADLLNDTRFTGLPGQIAMVDGDKNPCVVVGDRLLRFTEYEVEGGTTAPFVVGKKFS